ncbi:MAG: hypothetical protein IIB26_08465 [Chloroflexi bacterium]|nr:hypothetical protein [Chloroflexota bacterium]
MTEERTSSVPAPEELEELQEAIEAHLEAGAPATAAAQLEDLHAHDVAEVISERGGFEPVIIKGTDDMVGIITVHDGPALPQGRIIAPTVGDDPTNPPGLLRLGERRDNRLTFD